MRWPALAAATLMVAITGCDRIPGLGGGEEETSPPDAAATATTQVQDTVEQPQEPETTPEPAQQDPPPPAQPQVRQPVSSGVDEPWTPTHTGTVNPGMTRDDVVAAWGDPVTERSTEEWTYLYYRNGCEVTCGTYDVVLLRGGQVADAIVRGPGHTYTGVSSSPPDNAAQFTPPGG